MNTNDYPIQLLCGSRELQIIIKNFVDGKKLNLRHLRVVGSWIESCA